VTNIASTEKSWMIGVASRGRSDFLNLPRKGTWRYFSPNHNHLRLFLRESEVEFYVSASIDPIRIISVPDDTMIADKRQRILKYANDKGFEYLFMADDDLLLDHRRQDDKTKFRANYEVPGKTEEMIETCLRICGPKYPIVHPRIRFHADTAKYRYEKNSPAIRFTCLHVPTFFKEGIQANGLGERFMFDRYLQNSILSRGYVTIALGQFCVGDYGTGKKGGCEEIRDPATHSASAKAMVRLFPNVRLKAKNNGSWAETRYDCIQYLKRYISKGELNYVPKEEMEKDWDDV